MNLQSTQNITKYSLIPGQNICYAEINSSS